MTIHFIENFEEEKRLCDMLIKTPHYAKLGEAGIFAIIQKSRSVGMDIMEALNGGMYYVQGKVEMQGHAMLAIIRKFGHSVTLDPKSTDSKVIMHGRRCDNGDTWTVDFCIDDAKTAGIYNKTSKDGRPYETMWQKYPKVMCKWRCVSMLGRFLFSDLIKGCYVQGEISEFKEESTYEIRDIKKTIQPQLMPVKPQLIEKEQAEELSLILMKCSETYQESVYKFLKDNNISSLEFLPMGIYTKLKPYAEKQKEYYQKTLQEKEEEKESEVQEVVNV